MNSKSDILQKRVAAPANAHAATHLYRNLAFACQSRTAHDAPHTSADLRSGLTQSLRGYPSGKRPTLTASDFLPDTKGPGYVVRLAHYENSVSVVKYPVQS